MIELPTFGLAGRYKLQAMKSDGRIRPVSPWSKNLILDSGLNRIPVAGDYLDCCQLGESTVVPNSTQRSLQSFSAGTSNRILANSSAANVEPWNGRSQITYQFPMGAVGLVRELGIGWSPTQGNNLFSRALVRNALGDAVGVQFLPDESAQVEYELSVYAPLNDLSGTIQIRDKNVAWISKPIQASTGALWAPYNASSFMSSGQATQASFLESPGSHIRLFSGVLGNDTAQPGGSIVNATSISQNPYVSGSFRRTAVATWDESVAESPFQMQSIAFQFRPTSGVGGTNFGGYQVQLVPPQTKSSFEAFKFELGISWGRYDP